MKTYRIEKRKFTATGGAEDPLNNDVLTSKYFTSHKWAVIIEQDGKRISCHTFVRKRDAQFYMNKQADIERENCNGVTHSCCNRRLAAEGGKATCCTCDPHEGCEY